ncbi:MAG: radical SAM protein, partial [Synergistaceae bacterium]|nr:radical SAM protein [Synergistaceae bacterium]
MSVTSKWATWSDYRKSERATVGMPSGGDGGCAIFYPASYEVGMANLGIHYIYRALRELGVAAERFFASPIPYRSVERDTMLEKFPMILGSVPYEADVLTFSKWLAKGGISPSREIRERARSHESPLVGAGGAMTYINPLSLSGICDFVVLGDGVQTVRSIVKTLRRGFSREKTLAELSEHSSIYVPSVHGHGKHSLSIANADISRDYGHGVWTTPNTVFGNSL